MSIESVILSNHLILCFPLLLLSIFPSIRVFSSESSGGQSTGASASASVLPSNEYLRLISFRIDWFDLLAFQGTFRSLLQQHSSKASVLWRSAFFMVQLSQLYVTSGKTTALTIQIFVGRVKSLLFNILSRFSSLSCQEVTEISNLLISWFQSTSAVILEPKKRKSVTK